MAGGGEMRLLRKGDRVRLNDYAATVFRARDPLRVGVVNGNEREGHVIWLTWEGTTSLRGFARKFLQLDDDEAEVVPVVLGVAPAHRHIPHERSWVASHTILDGTLREFACAGCRQDVRVWDRLPAGWVSP